MAEPKNAIEDWNLRAAIRHDLRHLVTKHGLDACLNLTPDDVAERLLNALVVETPAPDAWKDADDKPLPEDDDIANAFPTESGRHNTYQDALRLVGARYSKGGLVALVNWLLVRSEMRRERIREVLVAYCGNEIGSSVALGRIDDLTTKGSR